MNRILRGRTIPPSVPPFPNPVHPVNPVRFAFLAVAVFVLSVGCDSQPKKYHAPDPARVLAAKQKLDESIETAHVLARKAQKQTGAAQAAVASLSRTLADVVTHLDDLRPQITDTARASFNLVNADAVRASEGLQIVAGQITGVMSAQTDLEARLQQVDNDKAALRQEMLKYGVAADGVATQASKDNEALTAKLNQAEKTLWWYRLHWWGSWIALGLGVVACGLFALLKFTGRLALPIAKAALV